MGKIIRILAMGFGFCFLVMAAESYGTEGVLAQKDLSGQWSGWMSFVPIEKSCQEALPVFTFETPVTIAVNGDQLEASFGAPLQLKDIPLNFEDLSVEGEAQTAIPSQLEDALPCYSTLYYYFSGVIDSDADPVTFEADLEANLSGVAANCLNPPEVRSCSLKGTFVGFFSKE